MIDFYNLEVDWINEICGRDVKILLVDVFIIVDLVKFSWDCINKW